MEYVDGEGMPAARLEIESHLAGCAACRALVNEQHGLTQRMQAWTVDGAPRSLRAPAAKASWWRGWTWPTRTVMVSFSAAAAVLLVIAMNAGTGMRRTAGAPATMGISPASESAVPPAPPARVGGNLSGRIELRQQAAPAKASAALDALAPQTAMVIRTATLRVVSKDFAAARPAVESIVAAMTGFVDHMTVTGDTSTQRQLQATLRIPADRMTEALTRLRRLGTVIEDTQRSQDVTDQVVDLEARLANARSTEQRMADILKNRTGRLSDVLEVERELARVRLDIERMDAEKTNLSRRVSYTTIEVLITEERKASIDGPVSRLTRLRLAALDGLENAMESAAGAMLFVLRAGPTLVLWGLVIAIAWAAWRRGRALDRRV